MSRHVDSLRDDLWSFMRMSLAAIMHSEEHPEPKIGVGRAPPQEWRAYSQTEAHTNLARIKSGLHSSAGKMALGRSSLLSNRKGEALFILVAAGRFGLNRSEDAGHCVGTVSCSPAGEIVQRGR